MTDRTPSINPSAFEKAIAAYDARWNAGDEHESAMVAAIEAYLATQTQPQDLQERIATAVRSRLDFHADSDTPFDPDQLAFVVIQVLREEKVL